MIKNYFKIAWRSLWKNKLFSLINILSFGLAIPFALLSLMQVQSAFEVDNFHLEPNRIHRVITNVEDGNGNITPYASSPGSIADDIQTRIPFVDKSTITKRAFNWELTNKIKTIRVNSLYVDPAFFEIFNFPLEQGSYPILPNTVVISREMAKVFFGDTNPVNQTLSHHDYGNFTVTGVLKPHKANTHFRSDVMVSMATFSKFNETAPTDALSGFTYVKLHEQANKQDLDEALVQISKSYAGDNPLLKEKYGFRSQKLSQISPDFEALENNPYADSLADLSVNFLMALAIILLAGFNYTNLTLAKSLNRAKEVGVRKVSGASRSQLFTQFICEAVLVAFIGLATGYLFLKIMEQHLSLNWIIWEVDNYFVLWSIFIGFAIIMGVLAGIIPAKILSSFTPSRVLKGDINPASFGKIGFRKSLVVIQFVVTACFIFLITNMYSQFKYQATDNENYNRKNIYNIAIHGDHELLRNEIAAHKDVENIGLASSPFGGTSHNGNIKTEKLEENVKASFYAVNAGFLENMNLTFLAGENLPEVAGATPSPFVVVNEQTLFALNLGTPAEAVGKTIYLNDQQQVRITGVVQDFNYHVYQFPTRPLVMQYDPLKFSILNIKMKGDVNDKVFKADIEALHKKYFPGEELAFSNYEEELYDRYFQGEDMKFLVMVCFTIFTIAIMGLLGIVTYTTEKRLKEIGIRKVLGASVSAIVRELSSGFLKLLLISAAICLPLGYLISFFFVNIFAYNNGVALGLMLLLYLSILCFALLTIGIQAARAAMANPVSILRTE
ncbi:FtsX-like permease family protein [Antarcticibacterium flavum]|uniref:FtsX-like permease family protein n=1 Tax=Antarcticibacterium flavum TaxID=2058175 RepID=A0A5B7X7J7_9FLAO|nr:MULTISPECIES: ABC transporter permease [Antarcticibacterium]MCM4161484.1 hypothetical protein [Antarcticibacterium sp. W02-3]QCY71070.1 FtsX-like permease family protein [Antarcticibacterium flavum]